MRRSLATLEDNENPNGDPRQEKIGDCPMPLMRDVSSLALVQNEGGADSPAKKNDLKVWPPLKANNPNDAQEHPERFAGVSQYELGHVVIFAESK